MIARCFSSLDRTDCHAPAVSGGWRETVVVLVLAVGWMTFSVASADAAQAYKIVSKLTVHVLSVVERGRSPVRPHDPHGPVERADFLARVQIEKVWETPHGAGHGLRPGTIIEISYKSDFAEPAPSGRIPSGANAGYPMLTEKETRTLCIAGDVGGPFYWIWPRTCK